MRFKINHEIEYRYSKPVFLEPHTFYLRPCEDEHHRVLRFEMKIDPSPFLQWTFVDFFGNQASKASFIGVWDYFRMQIESEVEVPPWNPFNYLLEDAFVSLPACYRQDHRKNLSPYFQEDLPVARLIKNFSDEVALKAGGSTTDFLVGLCETLYSSLKKIARPDGGPWPGAVTLEKKEGACRDLTVLFMECCRAQGLAARFTSGYYFVPNGKKNSQELHAWPEVYLEGAGWRGFDPTIGLACGEFHVPIASAPEAEWVSPVQGSFRGDETFSKMAARVSIVNPLTASSSQLQS